MAEFAEDIERDAQYLGITPEQFLDVYLEKEEYDMNYQTKHKPCDFLQEDGNVYLFGSNNNADW